eukprot:1161603-Pelagomonas_calceolata.AAC.24
MTSNEKQQEQQKVARSNKKHKTMARCNEPHKTTKSNKKLVHFTWGLGLQPGGLTAQPAGLCQPHKKCP